MFYLPRAPAEPVSSWIAAGGDSPAAFCPFCPGLPTLPHAGSSCSISFWLPGSENEKFRGKDRTRMSSSPYMLRLDTQICFFLHGNSTAALCSLLVHFFNGCNWDTVSQCISRDPWQACAWEDCQGKVDAQQMTSLKYSQVFSLLS